MDKNRFRAFQEGFTGRSKKEQEKAVKEGKKKGRSYFERLQKMFSKDSK